MDIFAREDNRIKIIFIALGLLMGAASLLLPLKYIAVLAAGAGFTVFSFYRLETALGIFIMGMSFVPNEYWNNIYIILAALFFAGIYGVGWLSGRRDGIDKSILAPSLIVYLLFCVVSLFTGFGGTDSIRVFAIAFGCILFSVLLPMIIRDQESFDRIVVFIIIGITVSALFGLYQYSSGVEIKAEYTDLAQNQGLMRLFSVMANPNNDAEFWVIFLPYCIVYLLLTKNDLKKVVLAGMVALCVLAVGLTYSRSAQLALIGAAGIFILLVKPRLVPVCVLLMILAIPFLPQSFIDRMSTVGKDTSSKYRLYIWEGVLRVAKNYWAQGIGIGPVAFNRIYRAYAHQSAGNAAHGHNVLLNTWVELGVGGFIALAAYLIRACKDGVSTAVRGKNLRIRFFAAAGVASLAAFMACSLVEYVWFYPRVLLAFWISMGMIHTLYRMNGGNAG